MYSENLIKDHSVQVEIPTWILFNVCLLNILIFPREGNGPACRAIFINMVDGFQSAGASQLFPHRRITSRVGTDLN